MSPTNRSLRGLYRESPFPVKCDTVITLGLVSQWGFPGGAVAKNPPAYVGDSRDLGLIPESGRSPGGGHGRPTPLFLPGEFHGQRSLVGYSPCSCKELDMTEHMLVHTHTHTHTRLLTVTEL